MAASSAVIEMAPRRVWLTGLAGAAAVLAALAGCALVGGAAWRAWLGAAFLVVSLPIGAFPLIMMMRLIPGAWGRETSPLLEAETLLTPLGALALIPVLVAMPSLYRWVQEPQATAFRAAWLSPWAFVTLTVAWLVILSGLAALLVRRPTAPRAVSCVGLVLFMIGDTFAATDWVQSLDPDFNSSGFGLYVVCWQVLLALSAAIVVGLAPAQSLPRQGILGGLLLTVLIMWGYFSFMPFFINWSGNEPAEAVWYLRRGAGVWGDLAWLVAATRFVPAFLLLFRTVRNDRRWLLAVAAVVALGSAPEAAWLVLPSPPGGAATTGTCGVLFAIGVAGFTALCAALMLPALAWVGQRR
jgi:hypothetical protein